MSKHFVKGSFVAKIFMRLHLNLYTAYISQYFLSRVKKKSEWKAFYSHLSNKRGGWNKHGGGAKFAKSLNVEVGINVEGGIFWKKNST